MSETASIANNPYNGMSRKQLHEILVNAEGKAENVQDPEAFRKAWSSASEAIPGPNDVLITKTWCHPEYPDCRIEIMAHQELCGALESLQSLPPGYDLMPADHLRVALRNAVRDEGVHKRYDALQSERKIARRNIVINDQRLRDITERALIALKLANDPPFIFVRGRVLVRINHDENGLPIIELLSNAGVRGILERCCEFLKIRKMDGLEVPVPPPKDVVEDLISLPVWDIPPLRGIIECPTILPEGRILNSSGYDVETRLFYTPVEGMILPPIPERPSAQDIKKSVDRISEIFCDFPFVDDASRTNMMAVLLTAILRPMINGPVPMAILDKPQAGTGATLLSEVIALVATGRAAAMMPAPAEEAAWQKVITSLLSVGRNLAIVDNVEVRLSAASLASVLTSNTWTDRKFGQNDKMITLPHSMVWIATGNNLLLGGDLPRRCYWVRLDAQNARPWQRSVFRHPDLLEWVAVHRGEIIAAVLTIARAWINAGSPKPSETIPKMGSFEGWRYTIGGILTFCDIPEFLGNTEAMYEQADTDGPQWEVFFEKWHSIWGVRPVTVAELQLQMQREGDSFNVAYGSDRIVDLLPDVLADAWNGKKNFAIVLGKALSRMNGRVFISGLTLQKGKTSHKTVTWIVSPKPEKRGVS